VKLPRPCPAAEAVERAQLLADLERARSPAARHPYALGAGRYDPARPDAEPWTLAPTEETRARVRQRYGRDREGLDCRGLILWAYRLSARRDGFNAGGSVAGWINTDSLLEDARSPSPDLFRVARAPAPGCLVVYPSIRRGELRTEGGYSSDLGKRIRVGHVGIVERYLGAEWDASRPECWALLTVLQCGSTGAPAVRAIDGSLWGRAETYAFTHPTTRRTTTITRREWRAEILEPIF
jgi:hypothetical protein